MAVSQPRLISDRAHPDPKRSVIGRVANEWVPEDRSDRPMLLVDVDVGDRDGTRRSEGPVAVRR